MPVKFLANPEVLPSLIVFQYNHMSEAFLFPSNLSTIIKSALKTLENH